MSVAFYGDYDTTETVKIPFNTFSSDDPSASVTITNLVAGDIEIHKDGGLTQRASDSGVTVVIDFDSITGNHIASIDLSDNTDAGFYADGSRYQVRVEGSTVDAGTINAWIGAFSVGCTLRPTTAGRTLDIQSTGEVDANLTMMGAVVQSATDLKDFADAGYDPGTNKVQGVVLVDTCTTLTGHTVQTADHTAGIADIPTVAEFEARTIVSADYVVVGDTIAGVTLVTTCTTNTDMVTEPPTVAAIVNEFETQSQADPTGFHVNVLEVGGTAQTANDNGADINAILTDTNELQGDWTNAGRLDLILDIIAADTTTDIPALIATAQADLDTITGADGVTIASAQDLTATMKTSVNTEVDTALSDIKLDHLIAVADADDVANDSVIGKMAASDGDWSGFDKSTDSLEAIRDRGDADWSSGGATNPNMLLDAEIATVTTQTSFTLATGSDIDDAYNDQAIVLYDDSNSDYPSIRVVSDYTGATKTVTIDSGADFTLGTDDSVKIFVTAPGTVAPTASQIVNEWETQSQADPTGFHVNVKEVNGTGQTANDNGADINTLITQVGTAGDGLTNINLPNQTMDIIGNITGNLSGSVGSLTGHTVQTADHTAGIADIPTVAEFNARSLASADYVVTSDTIAGVTLVATCTTNTDMVGTDSAALASVCTEGRLAELDAANLPTDIANMKSETALIVADTNELQTDNVPGLIAALNNISTAEVNTEIDNALNTAIPATPTADSVNAYIQAMKYVMVNKITVTEANGNTIIYKDNDSTQYCSVAAAYSSDATTTTRKRLE